MKKINHGVGRSFQYDMEKIPSEASSVNLPAPFFPPSLAQQNSPRILPPQFKFPSLPQEAAQSTVDTQDMYFFQFLPTSYFDSFLEEDLRMVGFPVTLGSSG
jgi:hypothetical protein